jgi:hypothetical protein
MSKSEHDRAKGKLILWREHDESGSTHKENLSEAILTGNNGKIRLEINESYFNAYKNSQSKDVHDVYEIEPEQLVKALKKDKWKIK